MTWNNGCVNCVARLDSKEKQNKKIRTKFLKNWQINEGKKRPSEFLRGIANVDRRVLNQQLNEMIEDGILEKVSFNELPPRVEYSLTEIGKKLVLVLWQLNDWGKLLVEKKDGI